MVDKFDMVDMVVMVEKVDKFDKFIKFDKFDEFEKFEEFEKLSSSEVLYEVEAKSFTTLQFLNFSWGIYPFCGWLVGWSQKVRENGSNDFSDFLQALRYRWVVRSDTAGFSEKNPVHP